MRLKRLLLFMVVVLSLLFSISSASADYNANTTAQVRILNSGPDVENVTASPNPAEPGEVMAFWVNVTDDNGVPNDIASVVGIVKKGSDGYSSPLGFVYNSSNGLYYNLSYIIPISTFGTWNINVTATDDASTTDWMIAYFEVADATAPNITSISDFPDPINPGDSVNIRANITDNVNITVVKVEINGVNYTMNKLSGSAPTTQENWNYTFKDTQLAAGVYNYTVYASDSSGNWAIPQTGNFTINTMISISLRNAPIDFGNTTVPITDRRADNSTAGSGYSGGTIKGFPLVVNNTGNVNITLDIKGTDLMGQTTSTFNVTVGNVKYDLDSAVGGASTLSYSEATFGTNKDMGSATDVYFWISIPSGRPAQVYRGNVTIIAS